jgi:CBS domain-containing protein
VQTRIMSEVVRNRRPITLSGRATVQEACKLMRSHRIGAVLVATPEGRLEGIFSGRDAVRLLAEGHPSAGRMHLSAVMTRNPATTTPHQKAIEVLRLMEDGGFRHVPVVEDGKIVGIASVGDFRAVEHARLDEETGFWERL